MRWLATLAVTLGFTSAAALSPGQPARLGLSVGRDGQLLLEGAPYRGIGVNYFDAFYRVLRDSTDTSYEQGFRVLAEHNIPFVRFMAGGFWPIEYNEYLNNKENYFRILDGMVAAAERYHIGLIPSVFWHHATVPDLTAEPMDQWGNPDSATHQFMRTYTQELVNRYKTSPAIWGWEFGNEFDLQVDLPNADQHRPPIVPARDTPATRSQRDEVTRQMMVTAYTEFARRVRQLDPDRIILSGNALPRPSAYHNHHFGTWDVDTRSQFAEILLADNPDPMDMVSVHVYPDADHQYFAGELVGLRQLIAATNEVSAGARKPLFVGEFGAPATQGPDLERARFDALLRAIVDAGVPLAAVWVFDYVAQDGQWNITPSNDRSYMLTRIGAVNRPLLDDVNLDRHVNELDGDPFVAVLLNGLYQAEADVNEDRAVNGLDVAPLGTGAR